MINIDNQTPIQPETKKHKPPLYRSKDPTFTLLNPNPLLPTNTIQPTPTLRTLKEVINWEIGGSNPNGKLEIIPIPPNLDDIEPDEENLDADAREVGELVLGHDAGDSGLVTELVGALEGEGTGALEIGIEFSGGLV